jgi:hypothetical protein
VSNSYNLRLSQILTPANVRAIGAADNLTTSSNVTVGVPITSTTTFQGSEVDVYQLDYSYSVSDVDFGLQNAHGLLLTVDGSCFTDYTWYNRTVVDGPNTIDVYNIFGSSNTSNVSTADGGPPIATCSWPEVP